MFYSQFILAKKGPLGTIWIAAHLERKLRKNQVADTDIGVSVDSILFPEAPIALRLSSHLLVGVVRIYSRKVNYLFDDCSEALLKVKQAFRSAAVDLPPEESTAPYHSITLPETFDLDDFELPDNEIFQGNYVDHHVSTREQITLQDTMDGVVYSTSQFGLDERFGDGDTSQVVLDLDEEVFQDKDVIGSDDEGVPGTDHDACLDAAAPEVKDEMVEPSEAVPMDFNNDHIEDLAINSEFNEDAQGPQTPGLVEVPNTSSVRACNDNMEVEAPNAKQVDANAMHKRDEDVSSEYNAAVTPMEVDKSQIDENVDAQNEPEEEERRERVHVTSPCCSHITTEMDDPGQVTSKENNADKPGLTTSNQEPKDPGEENRDHITVTTEANQETDSSRPDEQLNNVEATNEPSGNLTGLTDSDVPAPEKVLAAPNGLEDGNGIAVESTTPDKEDAEINNNITGKKRTFTESTLTAESLNSVESVGLVQSKRTADSIPDDDDLLSSILVGKSSFLRLRPTPVLEVASKKRTRSAPRSTATKRKVLMDDPMVLHGDVIREQLTNTEGIRRVRKKAPCTVPEIVMLQRQALEDGLLKEPLFTGMSVELVSLHNEPYDLRGIMIIENDDDRRVVEENECSVTAVEENENEAPRPNDCEEHIEPQDRETVEDHQEETKDGNEISEIPSEDKDDRVGDLQAEEESHENRDEDVNERNRTDVIEIAEGDIDNSATLNEADLKIEDELPHEENKKDEVNEAVIDEQTPRDNTVEAIEISNPPLESCDEPLVEANNDEENPVIESDYKYEPRNEEAAYMQNSPDAEPTSRDGRMVDDDDTMGVAHDTEFLNVDDDEDHEDDDIQDGEETRLLENSGWSSRTRAVAKYLQTLFDKEAVNGKNVLVADKLLTGKTRKEASRMFFETLVLKTRDYIQVEQAKPYESISIKPRPKLTKSVF